MYIGLPHIVRFTNYIEFKCVTVLETIWMIKSHSDHCMLICTCSAVLIAEGGSVARCLHSVNTKKKDFSIKKTNSKLRPIVFKVNEYLTEN